MSIRRKLAFLGSLVVVILLGIFAGPWTRRDSQPGWIVGCAEDLPLRVTREIGWTTLITNGSEVATGLWTNRSTASGFLVRYKGRKFLVSNAHVIDKDNLHAITLQGSGKTSNTLPEIRIPFKDSAGHLLRAVHTNEVRITNSELTGGRTNSPVYAIDVAVLVVDDPRLGRFPFIDVAKMTSSNSGASGSGLQGVVGYPKEKLQPEWRVGVATNFDLLWAKIYGDWKISHLKQASTIMDEGGMSGGPLFLLRGELEGAKKAIAADPEHSFSSQIVEWIGMIGYASDPNMCNGPSMKAILEVLENYDSWKGVEIPSGRIMLLRGGGEGGKPGEGEGFREAFAQ